MAFSITKNGLIGTGVEAATELGLWDCFWSGSGDSRLDGPQKVTCVSRVVPGGLDWTQEHCWKMIETGIQPLQQHLRNKGELYEQVGLG